MKLRRVILYGHLRKRFGKEFLLAVESPAEAIRALCTVIDGFRAHMLKYSEPGYRVLVGGEVRGKDELHAPMGQEEIKIVPVVAGAKGDFAGVVIGSILIAASFIPGCSFLLPVGISMIIGGVAQVLTASPVYDQSAGDKGPGDAPTYSFSGPHLTVGQGNPVPVLLGGPLRIGGALISMGMSNGAWPTNGLGGKGNEATPTVAVGNGDTTPWVWAKEPA